jgi:transposase
VSACERSGRLKNRRRSFTEEFRRRVVAETERPGASIAGIALGHGINANVVHKWRQRLLGPSRPAPRKAAREALIPIAVVPDARTPIEPVRAVPEPMGSLKIELPRARIEVIGRVDLDALQAVLAVLRPR